MAYWSIYVSDDEEKTLKSKILRIAERKRWSFSQAVSGILREHLLEEKNCMTDDQAWALLTTQSFFEGYSERDSAYDDL